MKINRWNFVIGGGAFGSAIACNLFQAHIPLVLVVPENPMDLRWPISFSEAVYYGKKIIGKSTARLVAPAEDAPVAVNECDDYSDFLKKSINYYLNNREIPVITFADYATLEIPASNKIVIKTIADGELTVDLDDARRVIGLLPMHQPGTSCHLAIESRLWAQAGDAYHASEMIPERISSESQFPVETISAPLEGAFTAYKTIGDKIHKNDSIGAINGIDIKSAYDGQLWGILHSGKIINAKQSIAMINLRQNDVAYQTYGFDHKIVAGAVLREILKISAGQC